MPTRPRSKPLTILMPVPLKAELHKLATARMTTLAEVVRAACLAEVQRTRVENPRASR
jgi:hypothetical protein